MIKKILIAFIHSYQQTLSPDHGWFSSLHPYGYCRHFPTCSEYACQAIDRYGAIKGSLLALTRIVRCNPYAKPSVDTLP